jgi:hypothetical protein
MKSNAPASVQDNMKNKILERRAALEAAHETLNYQIKHLKKFYSREQVRCWYVNRDRIVWTLDHMPTEEQIQKDAKRINFSNSSKIKSHAKKYNTTTVPQQTQMPL